MTRFSADAAGSSEPSDLFLYEVYNLSGRAGLAAARSALKCARAPNTVTELLRAPRTYNSARDETVTGH